MMMRRRVILVVCIAIMVMIAAWAISIGLDRIMRPQLEPQAQESTPAPQRPAAPERHITATLFYVSSDGQRLVAVQREVPFGEGPVEQGRQIVNAQLTLAPDAPLLAAVPAGATLHSFYVSERGEAFVDLGREIVAAHPGGSAAELLTVYAIVNAVTANLPALGRVQILIDGREADTLAGHVDLRRTMQRNDAIVAQATKK